MHTDWLYPTISFAAPRSGHTVYMCHIETVHQCFKGQYCSPGALPDLGLSLSTIYHLNLPRITSTSGEEGELLLNKVTNLYSRMSSLRNTKSLQVELLRHFAEHETLKCVLAL